MRNCLYLAGVRVFVNLFAGISPIGTYVTVMLPFVTFFFTSWYFRRVCFVRLWCFGLYVIFIAPLLSFISRTGPYIGRFSLENNL